MANQIDTSRPYVCGIGAQGPNGPLVFTITSDGVWKLENPNVNIKATERKLMMQLIDPVFEQLLTRALQNGAEKYGAKNYLQPGLPISHYIGAIKRHLADFMMGDEIDHDSGLPNLIMIASNVHILFEILYDAKGPTSEDDRTFLYPRKNQAKMREIAENIKGRRSINTVSGDSGSTNRVGGYRESGSRDHIAGLDDFIGNNPQPITGSILRSPGASDGNSELGGRSDTKPAARKRSNKAAGGSSGASKKTTRRARSR